MTTETRRIAVFTSSLECGGSERAISLLARRWCSTGHDVTIVTIAPREADFYELPQGVERVVVGRSHGGSALARILGNVRKLRRLRRAFAQAQPDVIVSFLDRMNVLAIPAAAGLGAPVVVVEQSDPTQHRIPRSSNLLRRLFYPFASAVVVVSRDSLGWARGVALRDRVHAIPNPAVALPPAPDGENQSPTIVGIGKLAPVKGFDRLIDAFALCAAAHPEWHLTLVGEGESRTELERQAALHGLGERVHLVGETTRPETYLGGARIFAMSSRYEGFPLALGEAMAGGKAVIAFDCPSGPRQLIENDVDGLLVPDGDVPAFAAGLARLMDDVSLRDRLGRAAVRSSARFSLEEIDGQWQRLFAALRGDRMSAPAPVSLSTDS
jgi:glycosyltransferase involved in cell wall biosynthesis